MNDQNKSNRIIAGRWNILFILKRRSIIFASLICLTVLFPASSVAQPLAAGKSKFVGNVISDGNNIRSVFAIYWNQVTAENAAKWGSVEFSPGSYNWTQLDNIYNYAKTHGFVYKHHTLVWGNQQPGFLASLDSADQYLEVENWIKATGERYPDTELCDVVNEPLHAPPVYKDALGGDGESGWDWVIKVFELARQYWPATTKLLINEYSVINDGTANANYLEIINILKDRELVDGIGVQCHNFEVNGGASLSTLKNNLNNLAATGLPVYISEFDINEGDDNTQLLKYQQIFPLLYEHPGVAGITLWGYVQYDIWQTNAYLLTDRYAQRPAMQWLVNYMLSPFRPKLISPVSTTDESFNPILIWSHSDSADTYHVQVAINRNFSPPLVDSTVTDTTLQLYNLDEYTVYYWRVNASNEKGTSDYTDFTSFVTKQTTAISEVKDVPKNFRLGQNYPNPFNPLTTIDYQIAENSYVTLHVYDLSGRKVITLVDGQLPPGNYSVKFDSSQLSGGVYFYKLQAGNYTGVKKMIILK